PVSRRHRALIRVIIQSNPIQSAELKRILHVLDRRGSKVKLAERGCLSRWRASQTLTYQYSACPSLVLSRLAAVRGCAPRLCQGGRPRNTQKCHLHSNYSLCASTRYFNLR